MLNKNWLVLDLKGAYSAKHTRGFLAVALVFTVLFMTAGGFGAQALTEYQRYVHTYLNDATLGNVT